MRIDKKKVELILLKANKRRKDLPEMAQYSHTTISALLNGKNCRLEAVQRIAAALGVNPADIIEEG